METKILDNEIISRDKIDDKHKWKLTDIYESDEKWEEDFKTARKIIDSAKEFSGKLSGSADTLFDCLTLRTGLNEKTASLYQYARLNKDIDNRISKNQAMSDRAATLSAEAGAAFAFVEPELLVLADKTLLQMSSEFKEQNIYDFLIKELIRSRKHIRSEEVEELLAASATVARGAENIFSILDDADLTYPDITDENGKKITITKQRYMKLMESSNPTIRKDANDAFYTPYKGHLNTLGASLASSINNDIFYSRARKFDTCLHSALDGDSIPLNVYHSLLDTTEVNLDGLHKYMKLRKRILKLDKLHMYDVICPLFPERDYEVLYDQAVKEIQQAVRPLGDEYGDVLKEAFGSRWVDVYETEGKSGGAFSWGNYSTHPFVMMNYNETVDNMFTLAHEMGHALHSYLSNKTQPQPKSQYSIFVAEVASTLNEGLLLEHLLQKAEDKMDKLYLLNRHIDNTVGTFFNQILYARFELIIHDKVEKGGALSPDLMTEIWSDLTKKYYGPALSLDDHSVLKWSRIPHFYYTFYVYQYATSYAASQAILTKFSQGETVIIAKYLNLLSSGGSNYPIELLKKCDVDMASPAPVEATIALFNKQVDEMADLAD